MAHSSPPVTADMPSRLGRYRLLGEIAHGGMGRIIRVHDESFDRPLAMKVLLERVSTGELTERFLREAKLTGQLQHPGIPPVQEMGTLDDGRPYFIMKLVEGRSLHDLLRARPSPAHDLPRFVGIFEQICHTLGYAHAQGIIHRDLKPANVMVGAFGEVQVMDWGLAKAGIRGQGSGVRDPAISGVRFANSGEDRVDTAVSATVEWTPGSPRASTDAGSATQAGSVLGTPAYMPPEQARGDIEGLDARADVFGLGAILCDILTGQPPFAAGTALDKINHAAAGDLADAFTRLDSCGADADLVRLAKDCMAPAAADRPSDGAAVAQAVATYQAALQQRLKQAEIDRSAAEVKTREERKRRRVIIALAAAVLLLLASAGVIALRQVQAQADSDSRQALAKQGIQDALTQARAHQAGLDAQLKKPGGVFELLNNPADWQRQIDAARAALRRAKDLQAGAEALPDRLAEEIAELEQQTARDVADRSLALRLEKTREDRSDIVDGKFNYELALREYPEAFQEAGLEIREETKKKVAQDIRSSPIREQLVAALDDWALCTVLSITATSKTAKSKLDWHARLLEISRLADPDPWRDRARNPLVWGDRAALHKLVDEALADKANLSSLSPQMVAVVGAVLGLGTENSESWLRQGLHRYPKDFWLHLALGNHCDEKKSPEAAGYYRSALAVRPRSSAAWASLGRTLFDQKDLPAAIAAFNKALEYNPKYMAAWNNLGVCFRDQKEVPAAVAAFNKALEFDPQYPWAWTNLGDALRSQQDLPGAIAAYQKAVEFNPKYVAAWNGLGNALVDQKDLPAAIVAYNKALKVDPKFTLAWNNLGNALADQKELPAAIDAYKKALKVDPKYALAWFNLGIARNSQGDLPGAIDSYKKAAEFDPKFTAAWFNLGNEYREQRDMPAAIAAYKKAGEVDPKFGPAWINLGLAYLDQKELPAAIAAFLNALEVNAKDASTWHHLGMAYRDQKELPAAIDAFKNALKVDAKDVSTWHNLGMAYHEQKDLPAAIAAFQNALAVDAMDASSWYNLGIACFDHKDLPAAITAYKKVLEIYPKHAKACNNLGLAFLDQKDLPAAITAFKNALEIDPKMPRALNGLNICNRLLLMDQRLRLVMKGEKTTIAERLALADFCLYFRQHYREGALFYAAIFAEDPKLADDLKGGHRWQAAMAATQAAAGRGKDADKLDETERTSLRQQAFAWFQAEWTLYRQTLQDGTSREKLLIHGRLGQIQTNPDLASTRKAQELAKLPDDERQAWQKLWADADQLAKDARATFTETTLKGTLTAKEREQVHELKMSNTTIYIIDLTSTQFNTLLRLENAQKVVLDENDDIKPGKNLNSRLVFPPADDGVYRLVATSFEQRGVGAYTITIRAFVRKK